MEYQCYKCKNHYEITTDAVACCNCCDDGEFYDPIEEETEDYITCKVCGVLITGYGACYNCGYDPESCEPGDFKEDWTHPSDKPYKEEE